MIVEFKKRKDDEIVMTISRNDGSMTWSKLRRGIEDHDLAHFAVEQHLNFTKSFYGMIEAGADIEDFENKEKQPEIAVEAVQAEYLINLLQTEKWNNGTPLDVISTLSDTLRYRKIPLMTQLTDELLNEIRNDYNQYVIKLKQLNPGESFSLSHSFATEKN